MDFKTRHWSILGISAVSIAAIATQTPLVQIAPIITALAGFAIYDKLAKKTQ